MDQIFEMLFGARIFDFLLWSCLIGLLIQLAPRTAPRYAAGAYIILALLLVHVIFQTDIKDYLIIAVTIIQFAMERIHRKAPAPAWLEKFIDSLGKLLDEPNNSTRDGETTHCETPSSGNSETRAPDQPKQHHQRKEPMTPTQERECLDIHRPDTYEVRLQVTPSGEQILTCPCCDGSGEHSNLPGNNPHAVLYPCGTCEAAGEIELNLVRTKN